MGYAIISRAKRELAESLVAGIRRQRPMSEAKQAMTDLQRIAGWLVTQRVEDAIFAGRTIDEAASA